MKNGANKLERIAETIGVSLTALPVAAGGTYEQTASGDHPRKSASILDGTWIVVSHTVDGNPYAERFADGKFGEGAYDRLDYESSFVFANGACVKRMRITALIAGEEGAGADGPGAIGELTRAFEYSLSLAFAYRARGSHIEALPIMGYQTTRFDGEIASIKELSRSTDWLRLDVSYGDSSLTITDGTDVKTLERAEP
jgi:hypothetical protein